MYTNISYGLRSGVGRALRSDAAAGVPTGAGSAAAGRRDRRRAAGQPPGGVAAPQSAEGGRAGRRAAAGHAPPLCRQPAGVGRIARGDRGDATSIHK